MGAGCSVESWRLVAKHGVSPAEVVVLQSLVTTTDDLIL
jgi:hypothetical protein